MENIKNALIEEKQKSYKFQKDKLKTQEELNYFVRWVLNKKTSFKGDFKTQKNKALLSYYNKSQKDLDKKMLLLEEIKNTKDFSGEFILTMEWAKSKMWGSNPRIYTNFGYTGQSIGGCGYDKTSTATAEGLNSNLSILKLLYLKENERLEKVKTSKMSKKDKEKFLTRRALIGYGSGYGVLPSFEGGVGVSCHEEILKNLGLNMRCITSTNNTNVYLIKSENL